MPKKISILRIFDVPKATEFYIGWPGFKIEWEHPFEPGMPFYMGVSKDNIELHLPEQFNEC